MNVTFPLYSPGSALADTPLVFCLLIVQLVVAGVSAAGGCGDHGPGLGVGHARCCVIPRTCHSDQIRQESRLLAGHGTSGDIEGGML